MPPRRGFWLGGVRLLQIGRSYGAAASPFRSASRRYVFSVMVGMARRAVPAREVAGGTNVRATLACEGVAPLHAARTSRRDVIYHAKRILGVPPNGSETGADAQFQHKCHDYKSLWPEAKGSGRDARTPQNAMPRRVQKEMHRDGPASSFSTGLRWPPAT